MKNMPDDDYKKILKVKDVSEPKPKSNVVFKVIVAGLNHDDIWGMRGKPIQIPMPHISGTDAAGQVVAVGEDVTTIKVGDRVVSHGNPLVECALHILRDVNMTADIEKFGVSKQVLYGVGIVSTLICLR